MALTRDDVVTAAIDLLQEAGLDGLTLRRLASKLGVSAPTLYWHVKDKRELLDLMSEAMTRRNWQTMPPFPTDLPWDEKIAEGLRRQYEAIISYRDGARVVAGNRPTESALPGIERFLSLWVSAGFSPAEAMAYTLSLGDFVIGCALEHQAEQERRQQPRSEEASAMWSRLDAYPILQAAVATRGAGARAVLAAGRTNSNFERGLRLLMGGLRLRHAELMAEQQKGE